MDLAASAFRSVLHKILEHFHAHLAHRSKLLGVLFQLLDVGDALHRLRDRFHVYLVCLLNIGQAHKTTRLFW